MGTQGTTAEGSGDLTYAELSFRRQQSLLQSGVTWQEAFDNSQSLHDALKAQVALDQPSILQRQAELEGAEVNLPYTDIRSPVNGMVIQRKITIGQTTKPAANGWPRHQNCWSTEWDLNP